MTAGAAGRAIAEFEREGGVHAAKGLESGRHWTTDAATPQRWSIIPSFTEKALLPAPAAYFNVDGDSLELSTKAK